MTQGAGKYWLVAVLALAAAGAVFFTGLGIMPLTDRDEGEYSAAVSAMRRTGDYVIPTLNGRPYLEKPVLIFWAVAGSQAITRQGELGARLPSAASAFLLAVLVGVLTWRTSRDPAWGILAACACAFTPLMVLLGRACLTDALLTLFTTASLAFFFTACEREDGRDRLWHLAAWIFLGLGFLTKGPVALAVVMPPAAIYALAQRRFLHTLRRAQIHWGILIFLIINLPWYGLAYYRLGDEFIRSFFLSQNLRRFSEVLLGHGGGFVYYLPVILMGAFPFAPAGLAALGGALFKNPKAQRQVDAGARLVLFSAVAFLMGVFGLFRGGNQADKLHPPRLPLPGRILSGIISCERLELCPRPAEPQGQAYLLNPRCKRKEQHSVEEKPAEGKTHGKARIGEIAPPVKSAPGRLARGSVLVGPLCVWAGCGP